MMVSTPAMSFEFALSVHCALPMRSALPIADSTFASGSFSTIVFPQLYFLNPICVAMSRKHKRQTCRPYLLICAWLCPHRRQCRRLMPHDLFFGALLARYFWYLPGLCFSCLSALR